MTRVRACNNVKIKTGRNFPPVLKIVTSTVQLHKMLMLLCVHVTRVLFLVLAGNFALTMHGLLLELYALTLVTRSYALLSLVCIPPNCAIYPDPSKVFININWPSFTAGLAVDHWNSDSESLEKFITGPTNTLQCCHQCQTRI